MRAIATVFFIASGSLVVSACTSFGSLETGLNSLTGHPVSMAIDRLGYPTGQSKIAGRNVYTWTRSFDAASYATPGARAQHDCTVRVISDDDDIIQTWDFDGDNAGCRIYAERLGEQ